MKPASKLMNKSLINKVRRGVQNAAYSNALYRKILASGNQPDRLYFTLADPWPGDAQQGLALMSGQRSMFEKGTNAPLRHAGSVLRNLRAVGTEAARQAAVQLIENWINHHDSWSEDEWAPDVLGERIAGWIALYEFYAPAAKPELLASLTASLHRQWKHLARTVPQGMAGVAGLRAIKGLIYGGFNFPESDKALGIAAEMLKRQLAQEILPDGGHAARNPATQLHVLRHLIDLRAALLQAELDVPEILLTAITQMVPVVKFFRHGDGGLALFHGSTEETALLIDAVLNQSGIKGRALRRLPETGFERLTANRGWLLVDCAAPPARAYDQSGHAGLLSFEFGSGRERLIVNCGAVTDASPAWRAACAATAAHSTLTIEDKNACEIMPTGSVLSAAHVSAQRFEQDGFECVELKHDGYQPKFGIVHERVLALSADGEELRGRDTMAGSLNRHYALRWHLHPSIQASLLQSGNAALLRTPSGSGWKLRVETGSLELEPSIYCGNGTPRRSLQLKASGRTDGAETTVIWSLTREKRNESRPAG